MLAGANGLDSTIVGVSIINITSAPSLREPGQPRPFLPHSSTAWPLCNSLHSPLVWHVNVLGYVNVVRRIAHGTDASAQRHASTVCLMCAMQV
eukprot:4625559-Pyramimonas_sp.AAC.1